jgi:hypothetical protein
MMEEEEEGRQMAARAVYPNVYVIQYVFCGARELVGGEDFGPLRAMTATGAGLESDIYQPMYSRHSRHKWYHEKKESFTWIFCPSP